MRQTWRWFGPKDLVSVDDMLQAGVEGVVSALHHVPAGAVWTPEEISRRQRGGRHRRDGTPSGIAWEVVESLPVSEDVKKQKGDWRAHLDTYRASLKNLAAAGIEVICYNFMPVLDWTRTDLAWRVGHGGTCMRFDYRRLRRLRHPHPRAPRRRRGLSRGAPRGGRRALRGDGRGRARRSSPATSSSACPAPPRASPSRTSAPTSPSTAPSRATSSAATSSTSSAEVVPTAEAVGIRMCCHPDDPPFPLLGLPRVMSTEADYDAILAAVDSPANGVTLCSGSLGARPDNDLPGDDAPPRPEGALPAPAQRHPRVPDIAGSFHEAEHLGGGTDMVALIAAAARRGAPPRRRGPPDTSIPFRPDHGQDILDDLKRQASPATPPSAASRASPSSAAS